MFHAARDVFAVLGLPPLQDPGLAEQDRFLTYDKCVRCHDGSPAFLQRATDRDWPAIVERERRRDGVPEISDNEAGRIVRFLQEQYP